MGWLETSAAYTLQQTDTELFAAPGAGKAIYITDVVIAVNAPVDVSLEEEDAVDVLKFKFYGGLQGTSITHSFSTPKKLTANKALSLTTSAAVPVFVAVNGYVGKP